LKFNPFNIFKRSAKANRKATVLVGSGTPSYPERNYENYAKEAFLKNIIGFRCIDLIAKSVSSVPWKVYEEKSNGEADEVFNDPLYDLLYRPNPDMGWTNFMYGLTAYIPLNGNTFVRRIAPTTGPNRGIPKELYTMQPNLVVIETNDAGQKTGFTYNKGTRFEQTFPIDPITGDCDVKQIKLFNPLSEIWGTSITEPAAREIDTSNAGADWNKNLLDNQARPGMVLTSQNPLTDQQFDRLSQQIREEREGAANSGKSLILEGMMDAKPFGFSPAEMDFIEGSREMARRIVMAYGIPPQMMGIKGDQTYANYEQARMAFWEETVTFYLTLIRDELNHWLLRGSNKYLDFDIDDMPAFESKRASLWERARMSDFITINEKRQMVGEDPVDGGDIILVPATMLPLGTEQEMPGDTDDGDDTL
jgi:HK97 family phage portal protein